ncbi:MAG: hypothetical protein FWD15_05635 [Alphaproteobacteria bacterium]|nr:hypothetical protein [Alphaproteobacteria bacterium]
MRKITTAIIAMFAPLAASANPACVVCAAAFAAFFEAARIFGVKDTAIAVWLGAMWLLLWYISVKFFERAKWDFKGYKTVNAVLVITTVPLTYSYVPWKAYMYFGVDAILIAMIAGALAFWGSQALYQFLKRKNGGHAHFPFEKVVLACAFVLAASLIFNYLP